MARATSVGWHQDLGRCEKGATLYRFPALFDSHSPPRNYPDATRRKLPIGCIARARPACGACLEEVISATASSIVPIALFTDSRADAAPGSASTSFRDSRD